MSKKLYALTDSEVETLKEALHGPLISMTFTGGPRVADIAAAARALNPIEVPGDAVERHMRQFYQHMKVRQSGRRWVCTQCGYPYEGPIAKPDAWAHSVAALLASLSGEDQ